MSLENLYPIANYIDRGDSGFRCILDEEISQSLQVGECASRIDYLRHVRTFGRLTRPPRTRAAK